MTLTKTTTFRSPKTRWRNTKRITTTRRRSSPEKKLREPACFTKMLLEISSTHTQLMDAAWTFCWALTTTLIWCPKGATKTAWILRCRGFATMTVIPKRRSRHSMWEHHPAVGMRVTDEQSILLHHRSESGTQREQRDGCQDPSVACGASRVCAGEMFPTNAYPGVTAKVSCLLCCIRGVGNRNLAVSGSCVTSQDAAHRDMRGHVGLDLRPRLPLGTDEPAAFRQSSLLKSSLLKRIRAS